MKRPRSVWFRRFFWFILIISVVRLLLLGALDMMPQDAYYWQYSRHLAWGYFDHPPMHAYTAFLTTSLFGDTVIGVRLAAWIYGVGLLIVIFLFTRYVFDEKMAFWVTIIAGLTPLFTIGSSILTPDPPLLFFWTLSIYLGYRAFKEKRTFLWVLAGFFGGLAALSKYTAIFLFFGYLIVLLFSKEGRRCWKTPGPYLALIAGFVAFLPQFYWNIQNDWASFAFQTTRRAGEISRWRLDLFGGMIGSQLFLLSPILFIGIIWIGFKDTIKAYLKNHEFRNIYLGAFFGPLIAFFTLVSLKYWVKMNWLAPSYITGVMLFVAYLVRKEKKKLIKTTLFIAIAETVLLYILVIFPVVPLKGEASYWEGWTELADRVESERIVFTEEPFIAGWGYKVSSELAFYLPDQPETHSSEILGFNGLNYSYWTDTDLLINRDAIFVADDREPFRKPELLNKYFNEVVEIPILEIFRGDEVVTKFRIWRCYGYLGP